MTKQFTDAERAEFTRRRREMNAADRLAALMAEGEARKYDVGNVSNLPGLEVIADVSDATERSVKITATPFAWPDPALIPRRRWLFGQWLLRGEITAVIAPSGVGKSTITTAIKVSLASGAAFLGKDLPEGPRAVWLWNLEDDRDELNRQVTACNIRHRCGPEECGNRLYVDSGLDQRLCTAIEGERGLEIIEPVYHNLKAEIIERGIDVLTIDPFVSSHEIDENANVLIDPVARKRESIGEAIQARIPGMTDELLPRRDVFGDAVKIDSFGPDFLSPFWQSKDKSDPVVAEMPRIDKGVYAPGKQYTDGGERLDYSPAEYDRYHEIAGRLTYNSLLGLIGSAEYGQLDDTGKRKAATKAIAAARASARSVLDDPAYSLPMRGAALPLSPNGREAAPTSSGGVPPPPPGFTVEGESGGRNVYSDLQRSIPGIRFTSGFRDYEYNQSLKRRGYQASDSSTHMDGDTLDALPPPGKSLGWLRSRVLDEYPDAETLIHDGHLHFRVPGYYGAPVLGGAKDAGVSNPWAGMPPPPAGFTLD